MCSALGVIRFASSGARSSRALELGNDDDDNDDDNDDGGGSMRSMRSMRWDGGGGGDDDDDDDDETTVLRGIVIQASDAASSCARELDANSYTSSRRGACDSSVCLTSSRAHDTPVGMVKQA